MKKEYFELLTKIVIKCKHFVYISKRFINK
jgi:hypothetical protein